MLTKLKKKYQSNLIMNEKPSNSQQFEWFITDKQDLIGIKRDVLTPMDYEYLTIFLQPIQPDFSNEDTKSIQWRMFLYDEMSPKNIEHFLSNELSKTKSIQFLHFYTPKPFFEKEGLHEALKGLILTPFLILWKDYSNGVLVLFNPDELNEEILGEQIAQTLQSDFYLDFIFFIGKVHSINHHLKANFKFETELFTYGLNIHTRHHVFSFSQLATTWLLNQLPNNTKASYHLYLLQEIEEDHELIDTITTFIECNLNLSLTAKTLFMHRNTVQYRLDRFIERTGINIKNFNEAISFYLAIMNKKSN